MYVLPSTYCSMFRFDKAAVGIIFRKLTKYFKKDPRST